MDTENITERSESTVNAGADENKEIANESSQGDGVIEVCGIRSDMTLGDIMQQKPEIIPILMEAGMHCVSCPAALMETLAEAAMVHGMDIGDLMHYIEASLEKGSST